MQRRTNLDDREATVYTICTSLFASAPPDLEMLVRVALTPPRASKSLRSVARVSRAQMAGVSFSKSVQPEQGSINDPKDGPEREGYSSKSI